MGLGTVSISPHFASTHELESKTPIDLFQGYPEGLRCRSQFRAGGDCQLLLQCPEFHLREANGGERCQLEGYPASPISCRCTDFLLVKDSNGQLTKHCGQDKEMAISRNHGSRLMLMLRTKIGTTGGPGLRCRVSCCPSNELSSTQVILFDPQSSLPPGEPGQGSSCSRMSCHQRGKVGHLRDPWIPGEDRWR